MLAPSPLVPVIAALVLVLVLGGCGDESSDRDEPSQTSAPSVQVGQVYLAQESYGEEGSAGFVEFRQDGGVVESVGPKKSRASDYQPLGELSLAPGEYDVTAYQLLCGPDACREALPDTTDLSGRDVDHRLNCKAPLTIEDGPVADAVMFVDPRKATCTLETGFVEIG